MKRMLAVILALPLAMCLVSADEKTEAARKLDGTYEVLELLVDGKPVDRKERPKLTWAIKDGTITLARGEEKSEPATFTLDPGKKPAHIDIVPPKKVGVDVVKGIYMTRETDAGLELIIAHNITKVGVRPTDFKGEGERSMVMKLLRRKEK